MFLTVGILLAATAIDANGCLFPLAHAVVNAENDDNWLWFLPLLLTVVQSHALQSLLDKLSCSSPIVKKPSSKLSNAFSPVVHTAIVSSISKQTSIKNSRTQSSPRSSGRQLVQRLNPNLIKVSKIWPLSIPNPSLG